MRKDISNKLIITLTCMVVILLTIPIVLACSVPPAKIEVIRAGDPAKGLNGTIEFNFSTCTLCSTCPEETGNKWVIEVMNTDIYTKSGILNPSCSPYNTQTFFELPGGTYTVEIYSHESFTKSSAKFNYDGKSTIRMIDGWSHHKCKEIPEFPIIAIPVVTILGLLFMSSFRERKE